ncbi:unnamed protein product, partial [Allacma fusca]
IETFSYQRITDVFFLHQVVEYLLIARAALKWGYMEPENTGYCGEEDFEEVPPETAFLNKAKFFQELHKCPKYSRRYPHPQSKKVVFFQIVNTHYDIHIHMPLVRGITLFHEVE